MSLHTQVTRTHVPRPRPNECRLMVNRGLAMAVGVPPAMPAKAGEANEVTVDVVGRTVGGRLKQLRNKDDCIISMRHRERVQVRCGYETSTRLCASSD